MTRWRKVIPALVFRLNRLRPNCRANSESRQRLEIAKQMVRHGQEEFRRSLANLRAQELERGGLPEALGECGRQMTAGSGVAFDLQIHGATRGLDEAIENNLLRIAQECITNALRHAKARRISAELSFESGARAIARRLMTARVSTRESWSNSAMATSAGAAFANAPNRFERT